MGRLGSTLRATPSAVFGSTAARQREVDDADRVIRAPLSLSHRVAFVQLSGGVGASTVAAYASSLLAHRRSGPVLGVNASGGERTLLWHAGLTELPTFPDEAARRRPTDFLDASSGLARTATGLHTLDVRRGPGLIAATETDWAVPVAPIARFFDVVCTDFGVRRPELDLGGIAAGSHAVCLVSRADRSSLEEAAAAVPALCALPNGPRVVVAAVDLGGTAGRAVEVVRWGPGARILRVPYDRARSGDAPVGSADLSTRSRLALTLLSAALMPPSRTVTDARAQDETVAPPLAQGAHA